MILNLFWSPCRQIYKITRVCNTKIEFSVFLVIDFKFFFILNIRFSILTLTELSHCQEYWRCLSHITEGVCMVQVGIVCPLITKRGFSWDEFARPFSNIDGIACRVPGVWILTLPTYFNLCPFILNNPNCRSPTRYQLIFIHKNGNFSFVTIWAFSFFAKRGRLISFVHIYTVNWRCWLPTALSTVCWNSPNKYLI